MYIVGENGDMYERTGVNARQPYGTAWKKMIVPYVKDISFGRNEIYLLLNNGKIISQDLSKFFKKKCCFLKKS